MKRLIAIALIVVSCGGVAPTPVVVYVTPAPSAMAAATSDVSPTAAPSPTSSPVKQPTPTTKPTLRPAALTFGKLGYTSAGCWSADYRDAEGHSISGTMVDFKVTAKNSGQVKSRLIPIRIETTDWFTTEPLLTATSWKDATVLHDDRSIDVVGPAVLPGKSRSISWSVLFQSPWDVHYIVEAAGREWDLWTSTEVCF